MQSWNETTGLPSGKGGIYSSLFISLAQRCKLFRHVTSSWALKCTLFFKINGYSHVYIYIDGTAVHFFSVLNTQGAHAHTHVCVCVCARLWNVLDGAVCVLSFLFPSIPPPPFEREREREAEGKCNQALYTFLLSIEQEKNIECAGDSGLEGGGRGRKKLAEASQDGVVVVVHEGGVVTSGKLKNKEWDKFLKSFSPSIQGQLQLSMRGPGGLRDPSMHDRPLNPSRQDRTAILGGIAIAPPHQRYLCGKLKHGTPSSFFRPHQRY